MNRRQKKAAKVHVAKVPDLPTEQIEESRHEYICEGCEKVTSDIRCRVYPIIPSNYIRLGCCPFNRQLKSKVKGKVRVGQQKGKSQRVR